MERLTGQDAGFLYNETPTQHMHTLKIAVVDPAATPDGYSFDRFRQAFSSRLHLLPALRRRVIFGPLRLAHPWWVDDPDFDLDRHLHQTTAPSPGDQMALDTVASQIASVPLDRDKPLWEIWAVEGLAGGRIAFITKIHHCLADGARAVEMMTAVTETEPEVPAPTPLGQALRPPPLPSRWRRMTTALRDIYRITLTIPALVVRTIKGVRDLIRHRKQGGPRPAVPFTGPATSFNGALTANRLFVTGSLSLDQIKRVKNAHGTTLNDVLLAVVAGALRRYLDERSELPDRALVAGVPVSTRTGQEEAANRVSNLFVALPVEDSDPAARLRTVHLSTIGAKAQYNVLGADMLADWSELTPGRPYSAVLRWYSRKDLADRTPSPINLIVSNVPGPREPRYLGGALITELYSMGPILEGVGLNLTMWSYLDRLYAGVVACPEALGDLRRLVELLPEALDDLEAATPAVAPTS